MNRDETPPAPAASEDLRKFAEGQLARGPSVGHLTSAMTDADLMRLAHELDVHRVELELQNEQLRQSRREVEAGLERYTELFDFAPLGYFRVAPDGCILQANQAVAAILGMERSRLVGQRVAAFLDPHSLLPFTDFMTELFATEQPQATEVRLHAGPNGPAIVVVTGSIPPGAAEAFLAIVDVTEQHRMAEELRVTGERYRRIVETTPEGIAITDAAADLVFVNPRLAAMLGYKCEELLGRSGFMIVDSEQRAMVEERLARRRAGIPETFELKLRHRAGHEVWARVTSTPLHDTQGLYEGALALVSDITTRRQAEGDLRASQEQLLQSQKWRRSAHWRVASPMTSTTCSR